MFESLRRLISGPAGSPPNHPLHDLGMDGALSGKHPSAEPRGLSSSAAKQHSAELVHALRLVESSDLSAWSRTVSRMSTKRDPELGSSVLPEGYRARLDGLDLIVGEYHPRYSEGFPVTQGGPAIVVNETVYMDAVVAQAFELFSARVQEFRSSRQAAFHEIATEFINVASAKELSYLSVCREHGWFDRPGLYAEFRGASFELGRRNSNVPALDLRATWDDGLVQHAQFWHGVEVSAWLSNVLEVHVTRPELMNNLKRVWNLDDARSNSFELELDGERILAEGSRREGLGELELRLPKTGEEYILSEGPVRSGQLIVRYNRDGHVSHTFEKDWFKFGLATQAAADERRFVDRLPTGSVRRP